MTTADSMAAPTRLRATENNIWADDISACAAPATAAQRTPAHAQLNRRTRTQSRFYKNTSLFPLSCYCCYILLLDFRFLFRLKFLLIYSLLILVQVEKCWCIVLFRIKITGNVMKYPSSAYIRPLPALLNLGHNLCLSPMRSYWSIYTKLARLVDAGFYFKIAEPFW